MYLLKILKKIALLIENKTIRLVFFPTISILLLIIIVIGNQHLFQENSRSIIHTYISSALEGHTGYGLLVSDHNNQLPLEELEIGDIILGGWSNCAYGRFSHVGLYIGNNRVLESFIDHGNNIQSVGHFKNYTEAAIVRVNTSEEVKRQVVEYAVAQNGGMFYPVAFKKGERYWNCSKIIWMSYLKQGIDLDEINDLWIAPDGFYHNSKVELIADKGKLIF